MTWAEWSSGHYTTGLEHLLSSRAPGWSSVGLPPPQGWETRVIRWETWVGGLGLGRGGG